jgi:integrase
MKGSLLRRSKRGVQPIVWTLRAELPRDPREPTKRKQKAITFRGTKEEAEDALHRFVRSVRTGSMGDGQITFDDLFEKWIVAESSRQLPRAASTAYHDRRRYKQWVQPVFGGRPVTSVLALEIENHYEQVRKGNADGSPGLSLNSVVRIHALMAAMTRWGFRKQLIDKNPLQFVTKPRGQALPPEAPTTEEVQRLLEYLWGSDRRLWLAVRLASTLGLRRSEILALTYADFFLDSGLENLEGHLHIDSGIVAVPGEKDFITTETKGGAQSHRTLHLDREVTGVIREMVLEMNFRNLGGYVFSHTAQGVKPWYPDTLSRKLNVATAKLPHKLWRLGVTSRVPITFRSLRIYCASQLFANEADVRTAKAVLGHASLLTTDKYYLAFNEQKQREATIAVGNQLTRSPFAGVEY